MTEEEQSAPFLSEEKEEEVRSKSRDVMQDIMENPGDTNEIIDGFINEMFDVVQESTGGGEGGYERLSYLGHRSIPNSRKGS